jgi:hypothetical protein
MIDADQTQTGELEQPVNSSLSQLWPSLPRDRSTDFRQQ